MKKYIIMWMSVALFISCSDNNDTETIVKQSISIDTEVIEFDGKGSAMTGMNTVTVTSSSAWRIVGDTSWCTPSIEKGSDGDKISFTVSISDSEAVRHVNLVFICGDAATKLLVRQVPEPTLEFIKVEERYEVDAEGDNITIKLKTNLEQLHSEISEDWISLLYYPENSTTTEKWVQFEISPNATFIMREATITLFKDTPIEKTVTVEQKPYSGILIEGDEMIEFGVNGGTATFKATGDTEFSVMSGWSSDWVTVEEVSSEGTDIITKTFKVTCQPSEYPRRETLPLSSILGTTVYLNVVQTNPDPTLFDVPDAFFGSRLVDIGYMEKKGDKYYLTYSGYTATSLQLYDEDYALASIEGIERLVHLSSLSLYGVNIKKIDLSKNRNLTDFYTNYVPISELILGDLELDDYSISDLYSYHNDADSPRSFKISGSKITTLDLDEVHENYNDHLESIDITACPKLETLNCDRASGLLKTIYVTQAQKDAFDAGTLIISTNPTYPVSIVPK